MVSPSETDGIDVRVEGDDSPDLPVNVLSADGTKWVPETEKSTAEAPTVEEAEAFRKAAENPAVVEANEKTQALIKLLEQNAKAVAKSIRAAQPEDKAVIDEIVSLEKAGKNRSTVLDAAKAKIASFKEEAEAKPKKTKKAKKPRKPKAPKIVIMGNVKEVLGSFWKDDKGNIFVLDGKMGEPTGVFALRLTKRARS